MIGPPRAAMAEAGGGVAMTREERRLAEAVRAACLAAAREAYEDAGLRGLCAEGRWEAATGAIAACDLSSLAHVPAAPREPRP